MYQTAKSGYPNDEKRSFSDKFKAMLALEAQRDDKTAPEIAAKHNVLPAESNAAKVKERHVMIGRLEVENDFLSQGLNRCAPTNAKQ